MLGGAGGPALLISFFYFAQRNQKLFFFLRSLEYFALVQRIVHFFLLISERYSRVPGTELRATRTRRGAGARERVEAGWRF